MFKNTLSVFYCIFKRDTSMIVRSVLLRQYNVLALRNWDKAAFSIGVPTKMFWLYLDHVFLLLRQDH